MSGNPTRHLPMASSQKCKAVTNFRLLSGGQGGMVLHAMERETSDERNNDK